MLMEIWLGLSVCIVMVILLMWFICVPMWDTMSSHLDSSSGQKSPIPFGHGFQTLSLPLGSAGFMGMCRVTWSCILG